MPWTDVVAFFRGLNWIRGLRVTACYYMVCLAVVIRGFLIPVMIVILSSVEFVTVVHVCHVFFFLTCCYLIYPSIKVIPF